MMAAPSNAVVRPKDSPQDAGRVTPPGTITPGWNGFLL